MKEGLIFASARARAKELNLFTEERLYRMIEAKSMTDAVRILSESGYGGGAPVTDKNFYEVLASEEREVTEFLRSAAPKGTGIECFFLKNDYHNLKVIIKAKYADIKDYQYMLLPDGTITAQELKERFDNAKLSFVSRYMDEAVKVITKKFDTDGISPRTVDVELDKAMYREITSILSQKDADRYIKDYFVTVIDVANIGSLLRTGIIGANFSFFEENFIEGGEISLYKFKECGVDVAKLTKLVSDTKYKDIFEKVSSDDLSAFETAKDNCLLKIFAKNKADMFSVAPIVGYYLGKLNEIKVVRIILVCIKNGVKKDEMKKRVRELYV